MRLKDLNIALISAGLFSLSPNVGAATIGSSGLVGLGFLGGTFSSAYGINDNGQVVGAASTATGNHAFLYSNGTMFDLGTLGGSISQANAINNNGQIVGYANTAGNVAQHAFLYANGSMQDLGSVSGNSVATGINSSGQVVGNYAGSQAFIYANGFAQDLSALGLYRAAGINDSRQVVGYAPLGAKLGAHAAIYGNNTVTDLGTLPASSTSFATAINNSGQAVGYSGQHAFLYTAGVMQDLGTLGGTTSQAAAINNSGQVVGYSNTTGNVATHATLWNAGMAYDLNALAQPGWTLTQATGINSFAQIAGTGNHNGQTEAFVLTLNPVWQGGNGSWTDASRWNFGGFGALAGIGPGTPHDVVINPTGSATVYGAANAAVSKLTIGGNAAQIVTLDLNGGNTSAANGTSLNANGVIAGSGRLAGGLVAQAGSRLQVGAGESQQYTGGYLITNGEVRVTGTPYNPASLESAEWAFNSGTGRYNLQNANVSFRGGMLNAGQVNVSFGNTTISGNIENDKSASIIIANGATATFWDNVHNNGELRVSAGAAANFFGKVSGGGMFTGKGSAAFEGGFAPGNSPAVVTVDFIPVFGSGSTILMELGGATPGNLPGNHDKVIFSSNVTLAGGTLDVVWYDGFLGHAGDKFDIFDFAGGVKGTFGTVLLPTLSNGLVWRTQELYTTGDISVASVPEPEGYAMFLAGLGLFGAVARRRRAR